MRASKVFFVLFVIAALPLPTLANFSPVSAQAGGAPYWPTNGWQTSTPEEQGIDSAQLLKVLDIMVENETTAPINSVLVIRHGYLVLDASMYPFSTSQPHATYWVTTGFLSAVVGIAIDQGAIQGVDQSIWDYFDQTATAELDDRKEGLVLENLLTMTSGLKLYDVDSRMYRLAQDEQPWAQFVLDQQMQSQPGTQFGFADSVAHLTSAIVSQATGRSAFEFAQENLFAPLGISSATWLADPQGVSLGGGGLYVSPYDMAKLGYLYLHGGEWEGQQIVSADWVAAATTSIACDGCPKYGYYWWLEDPGALQPSAYSFYAVVGYAGQQIVVFPQKDLIVVLTGSTNSSFALADKIIPETVLPAVQSDAPLPANPDAATALAAKVAALADPEPAAIPPAPALAQQVSGQIYTLSKNTMNWTSVALEFGEAEALLKLGTSEGLLELPVGLDGVYRVTPVRRPAVLVPLKSGFSQIPRLTDVSLAVRGSWRNDTSFNIWMCDQVGMESWLLSITYEEDGIKFLVSEGLQGFTTALTGTPQS